MWGGIGVGGFFWDHVIFRGNGPLTEYKAGGRGGGGVRGSRSLSERECNRVTETRYSVVQRYSHTKISDNGAKYSTTTLISSFVTRNQLNIPNFKPKDSQSNVNSWFIKLFQILTIFRTYKGTYGFFLKNQTNKTSNNT